MPRRTGLPVFRLPPSVAPRARAESRSLRYWKRPADGIAIRRLRRRRRRRPPRRRRGDAASAVALCGCLLAGAAACFLQLSRSVSLMHSLLVSGVAAAMYLELPVSVGEAALGAVLEQLDCTSTNESRKLRN